MTTDTTGVDLGTLRREVRVAHLSDALDAHGYRHQCLEPGPPPLHPSMKMVGRALTVSIEAVDHPPEVPYIGLLQVLDVLGPDDIYVIPAVPGSPAALWGELLSTRALAVGAAGALTDGPVRDVDQILELGFPTFARGTTPCDINGRFEVTGHQQPVTIAGVQVLPGDLIVGDVDGVVVVPQDVEDSVVRAAVEKARAEGTMLDDLRAGMTPSAAFAKNKVL
jgi:4-hydroxy-4-methyl-2-oxoglutarate aldolase